MKVKNRNVQDVNMRTNVDEIDKRRKLYIELAKRKEYVVCIWGAGYIGTGNGLQILKNRGIAVDYYCDNNDSLWGKEIADNILCISPKELQQKRDSVICFVMVGVVDADNVLQQIKDIGIEKIVLYNDLFEEEKETYFPFMYRKKIAVYTCIVVDYDDLKEPLSISPDCDYFLISDKKPERETIFKYIDINEYLPNYIMDNTRKNRYCKINVHKIFPKYRYSIYFDGNIQLEDSISCFVSKLPKTRITALCSNYWKSVYREAMSILQNKRDMEELVIKQAEQYWLEGMPDDFGSVMCGILIREHNNPVCKSIMEEWWMELEKFSKRDQLSLPYVLWKNGFLISDVNTITDKLEIEGKYWRFEREHNVPRVERIIEK